MKGLFNTRVLLPLACPDFRTASRHFSICLSKFIGSKQGEQTRLAVNQHLAKLLKRKNSLRVSHRIAHNGTQLLFFLVTGILAVNAVRSRGLAVGADRPWIFAFPQKQSHPKQGAIPPWRSPTAGPTMAGADFNPGTQGFCQSTGSEEAELSECSASEDTSSRIQAPRCLQG